MSLCRSRVKALRLVVLVALVAGCGPAATTITPVPPTPPTPTLPPPTAAPPPTTSPPSSGTVAVPQGNPPLLDGTLSPGEWDSARREEFSDGSELLLMYDGGYLYLGIRGQTHGSRVVASAIVDRGDAIAVLHSSAALGTALYAPSEDRWQLTQGFTWQVRDTSDSPAAQEARQAFLRQENWLASLAPMGVPGETEFQIAMPGGALHLAVAFVAVSLSGDPPRWPAGLQDDSWKVELLHGNTPTPLRFAPETWALVTAPTATSALPTPTSAPPAGADGPGVTPISLDSAANVELLRTFGGHSDRVVALAFSGDGRYVASCSRDRTIRLWDVRSGQEAFTFDNQHHGIHSIAFSPDGRLLASGETIWDVESKQVVHTLDRLEAGHPAFSHDGALLAVGGAGRPVKLWDVVSGQAVRTFDRQANNDTFTTVFSPDDTWIATSGYDGMIHLWDTRSGQVMRTFSYDRETGIHSVAFSPHGNLLASGGTDPTIRLWDVASGQVVRTLSLGDGLYDLAFSPDGSLLASAGCDRTVKLWDVESGRMLRSLPHADELMAVAFSPDGTLLVSGGYDHQVYLWGVSR